MISLFKKKVSAAEVDSEDEPLTLGEKVLNAFMVLIGVAILVILGILIYLITGHTNPVMVKKFTYTCESKEEQIKNTNDNIMKYYLQTIDPVYDSIFISPLGIQKTLYDYYNNQDKNNPAVFQYFNNGYKSWSQSGELLNYDCFSSVLPNTVDSKEALLGKVKDLTDGYIKSLGGDDDYDTNTLLSICSINYPIKDAYFDNSLNMVWYSGVANYKNTSDYEAVSLPLSNEKYTVYLIDGDLTNFTFDDFKKKDVNLMIDAYTWQAHGSINGLATALNNQECELNILTQFGFNDSNIEKKELADLDTESTLYYMNEYSVIVTDTETGTILAIGKQK